MNGFGLIDAIETRCRELNVSLKPARTAGDIMQTDVRALTLDDTVKKSLDVMKANRIRHAPVVDEPQDGKDKPLFIGVISQRDLLRLKSPDGKGKGKDNICPKALGQLIGRLIARNPKTCMPETAVCDVITIMVKHRIDMVPVLGDEELVGIITTTDILRLLLKLDEALCEIIAKDKDNPDFADSDTFAVMSEMASLTIGDIMAREVTCLNEQDTLIKAIDVLKKARFRHVLVTDEEGDLSGIVSDRDILRQLPYAGGRPPKASKQFRADLFRVGPKTRNLNLTMKDIMTSKVKHVVPGCSIYDAARVILKMRVSCLPVVDERDDIRGIVTLTDLLQVVGNICDVTEQTSPVGCEARIPVEGR